MSSTILPFQSGATDLFSTVVLGATYIFDVHWNVRDSAYYASISDVNQNPIASGLKVVLGAFLGRRSYSVPPFQGGVFVAYDTSGARKECGFDDLGGRVIVQFVPTEDMISRIVAIGTPK